MARRRRNRQDDPSPADNEVPAMEQPEVPAVSEVMETLLADAKPFTDDQPVFEPAAPSLDDLRGEYDRLAAEVSKAKPDAPGYKELRKAKLDAFLAWHAAANA